MVGVVFSADQPLRLDALLHSFRARCRDADQVRLFVLYRATTSRQRSWYRQLAREHPDANLVFERDFRRDLLLLLSGAETVMFLGDTSIFARDFASVDIVQALRRLPSALGCALGLDRSATALPPGMARLLPLFKDAGPGFLQFLWTRADGHFFRPLSLSGTVFRTEDLRSLLETSNFGSLEELESRLESRTNGFVNSRPWLLCPEQAALLEVAPENLVATPPPLVSVVIPCHRQASFLADAVQSIVGQTFVDWEVVIVSDGGSDDTGAEARMLQARHHDRRIRIIDTSGAGLAEARNTGVRHSHGAYILPLDADDKIDPEMLEKALALLEAEPGLAVVYTDTALFGAASDTTLAAEYDFLKLCANNRLSYCALYRREVWEDVGGYNANLVWGGEDWDFWIGSGEHGYRARRLPGTLFFRRVKERGAVATARDCDRELRARIVANHPALYDDRSRRRAGALLAASPFPAPPGAPLVSVIVPTFNRPDRLEEALQSVMQQTLRDVEIILVNDAGIDVTHIVMRLRAEERVRCVSHSYNRGLAAARNTGLRFARGKYVAYLDDDDIYFPDHLETLANFLEGSGGAVAYTDATRARESLTGGRYVTVSRDVPYSSDWDPDRILAHNLVPVLCVMHVRSCVDRAGYFDEWLSTHEDWDYWLRLSRIFDFHHIPKTTAEFRVRDDRTSMSSARRGDFLRTAHIIIAKHRRFAACKPELQSLQRQFVRGLEREIYGRFLHRFEGNLLMRKNCLQDRWRRFVRQRMGRKVRMEL